MVRGEIDEKTAYIQARSSMARVMEVNGKERQVEGKAKIGLKKRFILTTHENCEEFISSTQRIRNSRKPSRTHVRSWKTSVAPAMPCKIMKNCGSGASDKNKTKLACILEANESTRMRMETLNLQITKTILQEKVRIHYNITIWFTSLFLCLKL